MIHQGYLEEVGMVPRHEFKHKPTLLLDVQQLGLSSNGSIIELYLHLKVVYYIISRLRSDVGAPLVWDSLING